MANVLTVLSLLVAVFRLLKRRFTKAEWMLLALFLLHCVLTQAQLFLDAKTILYYDHRYADPAFFLTWGWLAWALAQAWRCGIPLLRFRATVGMGVLAGLLCMGCFAAYKCVRCSLPWTRRYVETDQCRWAAEVIRADWQGPDRDEEVACYRVNYHLPYRPIVTGGAGYLAYLVDGRYVHRSNWRSQFPKPEVPDYWVSVSGDKDAPPREIAYRKLDERKFRRGNAVIYKKVDDAQSVRE